MGDEVPDAEAVVTLRDGIQWSFPDWVGHEVTPDGSLMVHTRWGEHDLTPITVAGGVWAWVWVTPTPPETDGAVT